MIRTLLIDNGSESIDDYRRAFQRCDITVAPLSELQDVNSSEYQLVILGDGHLINVSDNHDEIKLIKSTNTPIIGICYGFQLLCYAYGAIPEKLPERREGLVSIDVLTDHPMFNGQKQIKSIEKHRFIIRDITNIPNLKCHAKSLDGCEIIEVVGKKQYGFQFHPETEPNINDGTVIVNNLISYLIASKAA